jgi:orotate phosphoribosyltransferase
MLLELLSAIVGFCAVVFILVQLQKRTQFLRFFKRKAVLIPTILFIIAFFTGWLSHETYPPTFAMPAFMHSHAPGGMVPAWIMAGKLGELLGRDVPYFYVRNTRKKGGHNELLTGDRYNDFFVPGRRGLVLEELVNFAETTCNSALVQREAGYDVRFAAAIASYDQPRARDRLRETDLELIELLTIKRMLDSLEERGTFAPHLIASWREFLAGPVEWQNKRGIIPNTKQEVQHG